MAEKHKASVDFGPIRQHGWQKSYGKKTLNYLKTIFEIKSMIDIGCGLGKQVSKANKSKNIIAVGVDGDPSLKIYDGKNFIYHDYTVGELDIGEFDLGWSVEFLEHVYEKYISNIFSTFNNCKIVFCTHAIPGQRGSHHVNCQTDGYWIKKFQQNNFAYDDVISKKIRDVESCKWIRRTGLLFINNRFSDMYKK